MRLRSLLAGLLPATLLSASLLSAAEVDTEASYEGRAAVTLSNGELALTVLELGGPMASLVLADDPEKMNPMWQALQDDRNRGRPLRNHGGLGHFVCVDGFGPVSEEEAAAGMSGHGEANKLVWSTVSTSNRGGMAAIAQAVQLPRHQEIYRRTITMLDGENVVRVHAELESLLDFDRPAVWSEHATIGSPFLERGVTVVDLSPNRAIVRPRDKPARGRTRRLAQGQEFDWPMAPKTGGGETDIRTAPMEGESLDHTGHLMTPSGEYAWVTALHPEKNLVIGYLFKTSEYPWLQTWENYVTDGLMSRGLEFGTQAFDLPRRQVISENRMFGEMLYRWLPAKSKIEATYLMFYAATPEGMQGVNEIELRGGRLELTDKRSGKTLTLETKLTLD